MLKFPLHNAGLDLVGKPPAELPHGLLPIPPEVRELIEMQREKLRPEVFEANREAFLIGETVNWYFQGVYQDVLYRHTPEGPEVLAVGSDEIWALTDGRKPEKFAGLKTYHAC